MLEIPARDAEVAQIETEVIDHHRDDRDAAQRIESLDTRRLLTP